MASTTTPESTKLFCLGNPLLDIQVLNGEHYLEKYGLKSDDAILAEDKHMPIYDEIVKDKVIYVAGGASQNTARGAAYILPPNSVVYAGCVGNDDFHTQLQSANNREGVQSLYQIKTDDKTGACAVIITGHDRSLVTTLRSAEKLELGHLESEGVLPFIEAASVIYVEGYFLTHGTEIVEWLSKKASASNKTFIMNLSAPFIAQFFTSNIQKILPHIDILIGNESEASAWATATNYPGSPTDLQGIAQSLSTSTKSNTLRKRTVIFTHGDQETVVVAGPNEKAINVPVNPLTKDEIVDTNGAGDAFAGGFVAGYILKKGLEESVLLGHQLAAMCVQQSGPQYKFPKVNLL
ncbi:hypothetical protein Agabi119p4_83 [Agaricus bisporus var. burnettii]|uniref:Adenosine kinase n=1 Tax=Agaricus bisporus var. burnettii TaxID=192524 RepID=A0A8H7FAA3_AGABI|nr:hypothetical protein Agabi119p4_83 [Agaricus bisporus var. burnettii]